MIKHPVFIWTKLVYIWLQLRKTSSTGCFSHHELIMARGFTIGQILRNKNKKYDLFLFKSFSLAEQVFSYWY